MATKAAPKAKKAPTAKSGEFAVIETGGKQYRVSAGDTITIEKLDVVKDGKVSFDKVLLVENGSDTTIGMPYISGAKVSAEVVEQGKGDKILVVKYKAKSRYMKRRGHRQPFTKVKITALN